jgi:phosphoketolase
MRSYRPDELFDDDGRLWPEVAALIPRGDRRMSAIPHANGGQFTEHLGTCCLVARQPKPGELALPDLLKHHRNRAFPASHARTSTSEP